MSCSPPTLPSRCCPRVDRRHYLYHRFDSSTCHRHICSPSQHIHSPLLTSFLLPTPASKSFAPSCDRPFNPRWNYCAHQEFHSGRSILSQTIHLHPKISLYRKLDLSSWQCTRSHPPRRATIHQGRRRQLIRQPHTLRFLTPLSEEHSYPLFPSNSLLLQSFYKPFPP